MKMGSSNDKDAVQEQYASSKSLDNHLFTLQNGGAILGKEFADVEVHRYEDSLHITKVDDLVEYLQSLKTLHGIGTMEKDKMLCMLEPHMKDGVIDLQKEYGTFIARGRA